ncbi:MAG: T9SS type A sorting domain-containing protein [Bacteroidota bacterium]|nr:T9SS type A sorting domain-containing protein [Bacteroidota bacterium]
MRKLIAIISLYFAVNANAQFTGHSGVYYLGTSDIAIPQSTYNNPNISGVVCRFRWKNLEPFPGVFNWSFIDGEIQKATIANKKICIQPLDAPNWISTSLGAQGYNYVDGNVNHPTYGQVLTNVVPFDSIYLSRVRNLLLQLSIKYANNPTVSYINAIGGQISRGMPNDVVTDTTTMATAPFWSTYNYNADSVAIEMNSMIDYYMTLFPTTPLWCSVDYVSFEQQASNRARNYLASLYTNHGIQNYPDRFGLWREDIAGCNPNLSTLTTTSHWYIMQQNPCRTGAQMLWNVQDGPVRMNQCGILPNTKSVVLDSAVNKGIALGMRYIEIYGSDVSDTSLISSIQQANSNLIAKGLFCNTAAGLNEPTNDSKFSIYPNPASNQIFIITDLFNNKPFEFALYSVVGQKMISESNHTKNTIDISVLENGIYLLEIKFEKMRLTKKVIINH